MATTYEPIATTTLGSATNTITFSSIASSWTDLKIVLVGKAVTTAYPYLRFNSDAGANYSEVWLTGNGSTITSSDQPADNGAFAMPYTSLPSTASTFGIVTYDIFSYGNSKYKTLLYTRSNDLNGSGFVSRGVCLWRNTSVISTISVLSIGNMDVGTIATLYGIKAA
jgi:hypothetical protein